MEETKENISILKEQGFFKSWTTINTQFIIFHIYPDTIIPPDWIDKRINIYTENCAKLNIIKPPKIDFFVYPSLEIGKQSGVTPAISFVKSKEIHGHLNQSPGHELTHILLGEINSTDNLPANGLWSESLCVYLDGTKTDRRKHTNSLNYPSETLATPWINWRSNLPGKLYPLAGSIIQYLDQKFGWDMVLKLIKTLKNNDEELIRLLLGSSYSELQSDWFLWINKNSQEL